MPYYYYYYYYYYCCCCYYDYRATDQSQDPGLGRFRPWLHSPGVS